MDRNWRFLCIPQLLPKLIKQFHNLTDSALNNLYWQNICTL